MYDYMKLKDIFNKQKQNDIREREYYQQTINSEKRKNKVKISGDGKREIEPQWWKPLSYVVSIGGWLIICIAIQFFAMSIHNIIPKNEDVGFFYNSGLWVWYFISGFLLIPPFYFLAKKKLRALWKHNNIKFLDDEIDTYTNDSYLRNIYHLFADFDTVPDAGYLYDKNPTCIVSHAFMSNKGTNKMEVPIYDKGFDGYIKLDDDGNIITEKKPMFDKDFGEDLYEASKVSFDSRIYFNPSDYDYNPIIPRNEGGNGKKRRFSKRKPYNKMSDYFNNEFIPSKVSAMRPAGVYFVDQRPANTILLAVTRAGKGQTYIEPMIEVWSRMINKWNIILTDPKAELLNKFYYSLTKSGYDVVQFNLLKPALTNVFNPLINAILSFRQGDDKKGASLIDGLVNVVFPDDGEIWNQAAGNMFKRAVYSLFDYTIEQEKYLRYIAYKNNVSNDVLNRQIDELYSKVTLYNVYMLISDLAGKISTDNDLININKSVAPVAEKDLLTVLFDAVTLLPSNTLRAFAIAADNAIKHIAGAQQTIAGVYASLLTKMSIYVDPTAVSLMSGSIQESFDVSGLGFPRRIGVEIDMEFMNRHKLKNEMVMWSFYRDSKFTDKYEGSDFTHEERLSDVNWLWCYWKGILEKPTSYLKLELVTSGYIVKTFYFKFTKGYKTNNGISYMIDEITNDKVIHGGLLTEIDPETGNDFVSTYMNKEINYKTKAYEKVNKPIITSNQVYYTERPKAIFMIVPPNAQHYQKHPLMILSQLYNESLNLSYSVKNDTKPIVGTKTLLDEFGNVSDNGKGIPNLGQIVSISLGQDIQNTFVLQSYQQLKSLYGEEVEKLVRDNSVNNIFLKASDKDIIDDFVRLSGVKHEARVKGLNYQRKSSDIITVGEPTISYSKDMQESTVLTQNDLLFLAGEVPGNSLTVISNEMPILNKYEHIVPCAWCLHQKLSQPKTGKYSQNNVPTTRVSTNDNFLENIIDGEKLVRDRVQQAKISMEMKKELKELMNKYNIEIKESNGDLSNYMMNFVYEKFDKENDSVRFSSGVVQTYYEITVNLKRLLSIIENVNLDKHVRITASLDLRKVLYTLLDDENLNNLTSIYRDYKSKHKSYLDFEAKKVYQFISAMDKEFPEEKRLENLKKVDIFAEAEKDITYKNRKITKDYLEFDVRNTYHSTVLQDIIFKTIDEGEYIQNLTIQKKNADEVVMLNGIQIGIVDNIDGTDIRSVGFDQKPEVLCDLVVANEILFNEIQVRLKDWAED